MVATQNQNQNEARELSRGEAKLQQQQYAQGQRTREAVPPPVDIFENDDEVLLVADVPGVEPKDVHIRYERGELTLRATRTTGIGHGTPLIGEDFAHEVDYVRTFRVSGAIDPEKIEAELRNGVLRLHLPKRDTLKPRQIPIKTS